MSGLSLNWPCNLNSSACILHIIITFFSVQTSVRNVRSDNFTLCSSKLHLLYCKLDLADKRCNVMYVFINLYHLSLYTIISGIAPTAIINLSLIVYSNTWSVTTKSDLSASKQQHKIFYFIQKLIQILSQIFTLQ